MRLWILMPVLVLAACAHNDYWVVDPSRGSQSRMMGDLKICQREAEDRYVHAINTPAKVLGSAIGGAIGGSVASTDAPNPDADPFKINRNIEACMRRHGYEGHSSG